MRMERNGMERERNVKGKKDNYLGNIKKKPFNIKSNYQHQGALTSS